MDNQPLQSALYVGQVRHRRFEPKGHAFTYRVFFFYLDLDEIDRIFRWPGLFAKRGPSFLAFRRKDYLGEKATELKDSVKNSVRSLLGKEPQGPIRLLTQISYFGFCFNPISLYYVFDKSAERVEFIVAHVSNTPWNERHTYAVECKADQPLNFTMQKLFHVSPFMPMEQNYFWRMGSPQQTLTAHMENKDQRTEATVFDVTMNLQRRPLTFLSLVRTLSLFPLATLKSFLAIYFEALRLFAKGLRFHTHPAGPRK